MIKMLTTTRPQGSTDFGPAMRVLTEKQQNFVLAFVNLGGQQQTRAAMLAGYSTLHEAHGVQASLNMRNPKVLAAIKEEADMVINGQGLLAARVFIDIASNPQEKASDRLKAATELANRGALSAQVQKYEVAHTVEHKQPREIIAQLKQLSIAGGGGENDYLKDLDLSDIEDADFTEVAADEEIEW